DRMLFNMAHAEQLKGIAGIRRGAVTAIAENDPPFGETVDEIAQPVRDRLGGCDRFGEALGDGDRLGRSDGGDRLRDAP
ncbi:hypothetical protein, partial [Escherichia coli]|uniref:hypothetical protein n=1 Tax=Escherichia coli TaxID=562 RepID=UPI003CED0BA9